jgi:hypothetical protein
MGSCRQHWLKEVSGSPSGHRIYLAELFRHFKELNLSAAVKSRSRYVREIFDNFKPSQAFTHLDNSNVSPEAVGRVPANQRVDTLHSWNNQALIATELCLNNREAIGGNIMKLSLALENRETEAKNTLAVLVVLNRKFLDLGGWDNSYGDSWEYAEYFRLGFDKHVRGNVAMLELLTTE